MTAKDVMDSVRYGMALFVTVTLPVVLTFWTIIHGGVKLWRRGGVWVAYALATCAMVGVVVLVDRFKETLMGADLGTSWPLIVIGGAIYAASIVASRPRVSR